MPAMDEQVPGQPQGGLGFNQFMQALLKMGVGGAKPPGAPQIPQGMPGTGPTGGPPQINPVTPGIGGAAPMSQPPVAPNIPPRQPMGPGMRTGPYANKADRSEAMTSNILQGLGGFISQAKERKEAHTKAQAENYMIQFVNAQQALAQNPQDKGAQAVIDMFKSDPKIQKTLEKGLDFIFPKEPGEPAPPEAHGLLSGIKKVLGIGQQQQQAAPQGGSGAMGPHGMPAGSPLMPTGPTPQQIQQMIQQQQLASQAETAGLRTSATHGGAKPDEVYKAAATAKEGELNRQNALQIAKIEAGSKGYSLLVDGYTPAVKGPDGTVYIYGDKSAPPDAQKILKSAYDSTQQKDQIAFQKENRIQANQWNRMVAQEKFKSNTQLRGILRPVFDARAAVNVTEASLPAATDIKKPDLQAQSQIVSAYFKSGGMPNNKAMWDQQSKQNGLLQRLGSMLVMDDTGNIQDINLTTPLPPDEIQRMAQATKRAYAQKYGQAIAQAASAPVPVDITKEPGFEYLRPGDAPKVDRGPQAHKKAEAATPPTLKRGPAANKKQSNVVTMDDMKTAGVGAQ